MSWANKYIGIPFDWLGDSREGVSCWGLVCLVEREVFGVNPPTYKDFSVHMRETGDTEVTPYFSNGYPLAFGEEQPGDCLHMWTVYKGRKLPLHCGVVVEPGKVLHIERGVNSCIVDYRRDKRVSWRPIGVYRFA